MAKYTNKDIAAVLGKLRSDIRNGATIYDGRLKETVYSAFINAPGEVMSGDFFSPDNFNPQTLKRFEKLFEVPREPRSNETRTGGGGLSQIKAWRYPTQDDYAWALQNFINRRANPWAHVVLTEKKSTELELALSNA